MIVRNTRELGGYLRQAREDAGITQAQLAEMLSVRRQRVLYLERGEGHLQIGFILAVTKALGVQLHLQRANAPAMRPPADAAPTPPPYSIDDIADGRRRR